MADAPNPWDRPRDNTIATGTQDEIYAAIGKTLSAWSMLENFLSEMFCVVFSNMPSSDDNEARRWYSARKLFGSLPSTSARLAALMTIYEAYFGAEPEWDYAKEILNLIEKFSARRNDIAHGVVTNDGNNYVLSAPDFNTKIVDKIAGKTGYRYALKDIELIEYMFACLIRETFFSIKLLFKNWNPHSNAKIAPTFLSKYLEQTRKALQNKLNLPR